MIDPREIILFTVQMAVHMDPLGTVILVSGLEISMILVMVSQAVHTSISILLQLPFLLSRLSTFVIEILFTLRHRINIYNIATNGWLIKDPIKPSQT